MRRAIDLIVAALIGVGTLPLSLAVAALVRWRLGRPVFFRQCRCGLWGREFMILKFRTLRPEAYLGEPDQDRYSLLGARLRSFSLDELPQLWNVLRGDMSLIGPRPTLPEQVKHYDQRQRGRLSVRPGITGWAQVNGRNSISWPKRIEFDLWYIEHRSLRLDIRIMLLTLRNLVAPAGVTAEGGVNPGFPVPESRTSCESG